MLLAEAAIIGILSLLLTATDVVFAYSVLSGGLVFIIPNAVFVWCALRKPKKNKDVLIWFYVGLAIKILMTVIGFTVLIVLVKPLNMGLIFASYGVLLLTNLTGIAFFEKNSTHYKIK